VDETIPVSIPTPAASLRKTGNIYLYPLLKIIKNYILITIS